MQRVRVLALGLMLAAVALGTARAQQPADVSAGDQDAIRQVIQHQMDAFRKDDGPTAFSFASPGIRAQFGDDPNTFMEMVRRSYQPVYHPRSASFGAVTNQQGQVIQHVLVTSPEGSDREALYFMEHEKDGAWKISGCVLSESANVGA